MSIEFGNNQSTSIFICAPRYAHFFAVKRPQSENKSINNDIHLRFAICLLLRGQTSAEAVLCLLNPETINQQQYPFALRDMLTSSRSNVRRGGLVSIESGNNQSTTVFIALRNLLATSRSNVCASRLAVKRQQICGQMLALKLNYPQYEKVL